MNRNSLWMSTHCSTPHGTEKLVELPIRLQSLIIVSANGGIRWNSAWVNLSGTCAGKYAGLEEIDDGVWNVYFGALRPGRLLERTQRIEDAYGRLYRHR